MKFGDFEIDVVETGIFALDGGPMFGVVPKAIWSKIYNEGDKFNRIPLAARLLLIRYNEKIILVDTGNGNKLSEKIAERFSIDLHSSNLETALKPFKITTDMVTDVILTHLHFDHSGGATKIVNGEIIPTFENAKYYVQKNQYNWATNPTEKDRASFMQENFVPLKDNGVLELLDEDGEVFPNIEVIRTNGHTKDMQMVKVKNEQDEIIFVADFCPTSAHIPIPYVMGYDNEPLTGIQERKKFLPEFYEKGTILIYEHDAFKQASKIKMTEKGYFADEEFIITDKKFINDYGRRKFN